MEAVELDRWVESEFEAGGTKNFFFNIIHTSLLSSSNRFTLRCTRHLVLSLENKSPLDLRRSFSITVRHGGRHAAGIVEVR